MKPCLFCGKRENSEEHVIAHSVWERVQGRNTTLEIGVLSERSPFEFKREHNQKSFVTRAVCLECNKGWMSSLEVEFLSVVGGLIAPQWPILASNFIAVALREGNTLAKWAVKTAITANATFTDKRPFHLAIRRHLLTGALPPSLAVLIAHIRSPGFALKLQRGFWFSTGDNQFAWRGSEHNTAFDFILQMNHFAIRAFCGPNLKVRLQTGTEQRPIQTYPGCFASVPPDYSFQTVEEFEGRLVAELVPLPTPFASVPLR